MSKRFLNESVSISDIDSVMDNHERVIITYHSKDKNIDVGPRVIEVCAYGRTTAGNLVLRAFQPFGNTTTKIPGWKFFLADGITSWKPTGQKFTHPGNFYYQGVGDFNPDDDKTMSVVYRIIRFGEDNVPDVPESKPKTKDDNVYKTDTEHRMERLRNQLNNPITLSDLKTQNGFKGNDDKEIVNGPRVKNTAQSELFKTDTERGLERLKKQLEKPLSLDDYLKNQKQQQTDDETEKLRQKLGDTSTPIPFGELNKRLSDDESDTEDVFKTDTERGMEKLKQQLNNPRKIDLDRIPKK